MPDRCVVGGCSSTRDIQEGISLHVIPFHADNRPESKKRRKRWVDFVERRRAKWMPSKTSLICSKHFTADDFSPFTGQGVSTHKWLKRDEHGICVYPTIQPNLSTTIVSPKQPLSDRERRRVRREAATTSESVSHGTTEKTEDTHDAKANLEAEQQPCQPEQQPTETIEIIQEEEIPSVEDECNDCVILKKQNRKLRNTVQTLRAIAKQRRKELKNLRRKVIKLEAKKTMETNQSPDIVDVQSETDSEVTSIISEEEELEAVECDEEDISELDKYMYDTETTETETEDDEEEINQLSLKDKNLRTEPKHIVFLSQLLVLFNFCHTCKADNPAIEMYQIGTEVIIKATCHNPDCKTRFTWHSQPFMPGSRIPAGNFLLCFSILLAGGSAAKATKMFTHMGVGCVSLNTFFRYQRSKLFPAIYLYWQRYQSEMLAKVKTQGEVVIAGDGRHDSMGHSAKYCSYTMFCCNLPMIIHFDIIQRNQAGSSTAMEFMVFEQCMEYLIADCKLPITTFVSDRHIAIASHMKNIRKDITHYYDIWHLKKKIHKVLSKIAKEKGCEELVEWIKPCENHLYWSATSTFDGNGRVIWAKFRAFMNHVVNKHSEFEDPLFNKCAHEEIQPRKWLKDGSVVYDRLCAALTKKALVKGIKQASPIAQTSCLEGFHSVLNHFAPKMLAYSYVGMYCRHILAAVHFNLNLRRKSRHVNGKDLVKVTYPKFKNGEATVRDVKVAPNFDYVEDIFQTFLKSSTDELTDASTKLQQRTPAPMSTMLEKQPRDVAIEKRLARSTLVLKDVPPTTPVSQVPEASTSTPSQSKEKTTRKCRTCHQPMKGHKNVANCPQNRKVN